LNSDSLTSQLENFQPLHTLPQWAAFERAAANSPIHTGRLRVLSAAGLDVDISGQGYSPELAQAARALLEVRKFEAVRAQLLDGGIVNITEGRAAWHTSLREPDPDEEVTTERQRLTEFVRQADSERRWRSIVHIGIGGSDWGVRLAVNAFGYARAWRTAHFVANIDGHAMQGGLAGFDPHDTLIVMASKSFTTTETLKNGERALEWLRAAGIQNPHDHIVAITARPDVAEKWGVPSAQVFKLWDWVGGRFSLWSAVSLTTGLACDMDVIAGMQAGAAAMDAHFAQADIDDNAPVQMAISGIVNRSVLGYGSLNIAPYDFRLADLVPYIQQLEMESLGKSANLAGGRVEVPTGPAVWGMPGTDAQHTFFQWLHQGSDGAPVDFIVCRHADHGWAEHHRILLANCLAQREALLKGKSYDNALRECLDAGMPQDRAQWLAHHKVHAGGRPSNLIMLPRLSPYALGALLALYEHKVFVQGLIWGINPFDQWGVEFGKVLATGIANELAGAVPADPGHDASTAYWVQQLAGTAQR